MRHIGLFFGTFDPLHNGHVSIAKYFIKKLLLDELWLVVTPLNPFKNSKNISNESKRLEMVENFCKNEKKIKCSKVEFELPKPNYTSNTIDFIINKNNDTKFCIILGQDNLNSLHLWKDLDKILKHQICVYPRKNLNQSTNNLIHHKKVKLYNAPIMDISSSLIRNMINKKESIKHLVPKEVFLKIKKKQI
jgi:nicotinate-nucleotide adenylyltransferase